MHAMPEPQREIADLEAEIEELAISAERCRKIIAAAKIATAAGGLLTVLFATGWLYLSPFALLVGISAVLGGLATAGSNGSTLDELRTRIRGLEARRAALIDGIGLRVIDGGRGPAGRELPP